MRSSEFRCTGCSIEKYKYTLFTPLSLNLSDCKKKKFGRNFEEETSLGNMITRIKVWPSISSTPYIYIHTNIHVDHKCAYAYSVLKLIHNFSNFHSPRSTPLQYLHNPLSFPSPSSLPANQRSHYFFPPLNDFTFTTASTSNAVPPYYRARCSNRREY